MSRTLLLLPPLLAAALLAGCGARQNVPDFSERHQLKPGVSDRNEVLKRLHKPQREADVPRHMLAPEIIDRCLTWDQPTLKALVYVNEYQETQVYLDNNGKVCASGSWLWKDDEKKWVFSTGPEF